LEIDPELAALNVRLDQIERERAIKPASPEEAQMLSRKAFKVFQDGEDYCDRQPTLAGRLSRYPRHSAS